jgi:hypothetical protein
MPLWPNVQCGFFFSTRGHDHSTFFEWFVASEWVAQGGYLGSGNAIHYTVGFNSNVPQAVRDAVTDAMQRWNDYSGASGIVLELAFGKGPDLYIAGTSNGSLAGHCAAFQTGASAALAFGRTTRTIPISFRRRALTTSRAQERAWSTGSPAIGIVVRLEGVMLSGT